MGIIKRALPVALLASVFLVLTGTATTYDQESDSLIKPFKSRAEVEAFLRTAKVVKDRGTPSGITAPRRLTLDDGKIQNDAVFKTIDERKKGITKLDTSVEFDFKDSWKFEVAAYEIDKLLSLNMVPVTVERRYKERNGSLQYWVEGFSETERTKKKLLPPNRVKWMWQTNKRLIFDKLIFNIDRNRTNILITNDWQFVLIDHSRTFKSLGGVKDIKELKYFSRALMKSMKELQFEQVKQACGKWLTDPEIRTTLKRRDDIVEYYEKLVSEKGHGITFP